MENKQYHFVGIGGIGMSALARILLDRKMKVSGSDLHANSVTQDLRKLGATVYHGHGAHQVHLEQIVVYNSSISKQNPEFDAALKLQCSVMHRSDLLAQLMEGKRTLAIAGTHGKTTTSSLLAQVLQEGGEDLSFAIGGMVGGKNGQWGNGPYFVAEADESDGTFLKYSPEGGIITNIEAEHLEHYQTMEALTCAFEAFFSRVKIPQHLFYCGDDPVLQNIKHKKGFSYGFGATCDVRISHFVQKAWSISFTVEFRGGVYPEIEIPLCGKHNALNGAAVFGLALQLGVPEEKIRQGLRTFPGVERRCQKRKEIGETLFLDDYGHHPTEIRETLRGIRAAIGSRRLVVCFQPHRYTRTKNLFQEFTQCFEKADLVFITDIYGAGEAPVEGVSSEALVQAIKRHSTVEVHYVPREKCIFRLEQEIRPHDVVLTLGAGDISMCHQQFFGEHSPYKAPKKMKVGLVFGGLSCEHEISLRSCRFVMQSLNPDLYDIRYFGIDKAGKWVTGEEAQRILENEPSVNASQTYSLLSKEIGAGLEECDMMLPILHGPYGEDGTLQGFFEMLGKPYIGPDYTSCAIAMNKVLTKRLVEQAHVLTPRDLTFGIMEWRDHEESWIEKILSQFAFPVYVKPVHLGSSVGISKVLHSQELRQAIEKAFWYDRQVMVEEGKVNCRELEFAVMGNSRGMEVVVPPPGEKLAGGEFVDYEKKYGAVSVPTTLTPELSPELVLKGREMARAAYEAVGCTGMTRVDFLLDGEGNFWFFEMNPIPGLQKLSLFPKIWNREQVPPHKLMDQLIILGWERDRLKKRYFHTL